LFFIISKNVIRAV